MTKEDLVSDEPKSCPCGDVLRAIFSASESLSLSLSLVLCGQCVVTRCLETAIKEDRDWKDDRQIKDSVQRFCTAYDVKSSCHR